MSNSADPEISVVIPVFNDATRLRLCLEALAHQDFTGVYEVLVADNGSSDSPEVVVADFPFARLLKERKRGSYAARNRALAEASAQILAFTDSDTIPASDWLSRGIKSARDHDFVGGRIKVFARNANRPTLVEAYELHHAFPQHEYIATFGYAATANLFVRRDKFDEVGLFDAERQSGGDRDWGSRATASGMRGYYDHDVVVLHPARASLREIATKLLRVQHGVMRIHLDNGEPLLTRRNWTRALVPPMRELKRELATLNVETRQQRVRYVLGFLAVTYVRRYARFRAAASAYRASR